MATIPVQPQVFERPFAQNGTKITIPDVKAATGRASLQDGFPTETQQPLRTGGVAPSRTDFNGILNMLSQFCHWQQSGGLFNYSASLNYVPPGMVMHNNMLYLCQANNGPNTGAGVITPGTNTTYWLSFIEWVLSFINVGGGTNPVGTIITYMGTTAPDGYLFCRGGQFSATQYPQLYAILGGTTLPDFRGIFPRGQDAGRGIDPDSGRAINSYQEDTIQNITSSYIGVPCPWTQGVVAGAFYNDLSVTGTWGTNYGSGRRVGLWQFDASRVVRTSVETRPKNVAVNFCIKHDD